MHSTNWIIWILLIKAYWSIVWVPLKLLSLIYILHDIYQDRISFFYYFTNLSWLYNFNSASTLHLLPNLLLDEWFNTIIFIGFIIPSIWNWWVINNKNEINNNYYFIFHTFSDFHITLLLFFFKFEMLMLLMPCIILKSIELY